MEVLKDIADEERVHAGEFLRLLKELSRLDRDNDPWRASDHDPMLLGLDLAR